MTFILKSAVLLKIHTLSLCPYPRSHVLVFRWLKLLLWKGGDVRMVKGKIRDDFKS